MRNLGRMMLAGAFALIAASGATAAPDAVCGPKTDGQEIVCGRLASGLRYIVQRNVTPPGAVSLRLLILAGSMQEAGDQHGVAHILEHMAFRGSAHISDGEMIRSLQRLGLKLGADLNAFTGPANTSYRFDLPEGSDAASVDHALMLTREIASELTLDQTALDAERPVVLAERRGQNPAAVAMTQAMIQAQVGDHPMSRPIGGSLDEIGAIRLERVRDFYRAYYRPERAVVIVAGDVDPAAIAGSIEQLFGDWHGTSRAGRDPPPATLRSSGPRAVMRAIEGLPGGQLQLVWRQPYRAPTFERGDTERRLIEALGFRALQERILAENRRASQPMQLVTGFIRADIPGVANGIGVRVIGIHDLPATVRILLNVRRQFLAYGLTQAEIDHARTLNIDLMKSVVGATTPTPLLANRIQGAMQNGFPYVATAQYAADFEATTRGVTAQQVNAVLRESLQGDGPYGVCVGSALPDGGEQALQNAIDDAERQPVSAYVAETVKPWTHTDFGPAGKVVERQRYEALDVTLVRFANGVRLNIKPTHFRAHELHVAVRFGHGTLDLPRDRSTAAEFGPQIVTKGGLSDLSDAEMGITLSGRRVRAIVTATDDAFVLSSDSPGGAPVEASNLDLEMQLLAATVAAQGWRVDRWDQIIADRNRLTAAIQRDPAQLFNVLSRGLLHDDDARWREPAPAERLSWKASDAIDFMKPILETGPLEVTLVGDVDVETAIAATARTFGALPPRRDRAEPADLRKVRLPAATPAPIVVHHRGPADQAVVAVAWPTTDAYADPRATQAGRVLTEILRARAYDELRVRQGATYAPQALHHFSLLLPGYGYLALWTAVKPASVDAAFAAMDAIADDLAAHEVSDDEFQRAQAQVLKEATADRESNGYWVGTLSGAQRNPRRLDLSVQAIPLLKSLTAADIRAAAQRWLVKDRRLWMEVVPQ